METASRTSNVQGAGRVALSQIVELTISGFPKPVRATLTDISLGGCRIVARCVFLTNSAVAFRFSLSGAARITARGKLSRCVPTDTPGTMEYGIEFGPFSQHDSGVLRTFIEQERERSSDGSGAARIETELTVRYALNGEAEMGSGLALDLGRGGMRISASAPIPDGTILDLRFALPPDTATELQMRARVVQSTRQAAEFHHHVVFQDANPAQLDRIERFVRSHRA